MAAIAVRRVTVVTAVASSITKAPLDILAFDETALINEAWPARIASVTIDRAIGLIIAVGRVAATVGTGIGRIVVAGLRRCCDQKRTEQCEEARDDQRQSASDRRAGGDSIVHYKLQLAR